MSRRAPDREYVTPVARYRMRYTKTGRARFASHRDFQRALERALHRADVPMAYSAGFNPHPKVSYANAAPTGAASYAEYVEIGVMREFDPEWLREHLSAALPNGFEIADVVVAQTPNFAERLEAAQWQIAMPGVSPDIGAQAVADLLARDQVQVERMTKKGLRTFDIRQSVLALACTADEQGYAILTLVVQHGTPAVRPDDIVVGLTQVAALAPPLPPVLTRLAQGPLAGDRRSVLDPLAPDRLGMAASPGIVHSRSH